MYSVLCVCVCVPILCMYMCIVYMEWVQIQEISEK